MLPSGLSVYIFGESSLQSNNHTTIPLSVPEEIKRIVAVKGVI